MVEETIQTIRKTERQAQDIIENARQESERIRKEAEEHCAQVRDEIIRNAREEAEAEAGQARAAGEETEREAEAAVKTAVAKLKASAGEKENEAVEMVISMLA